MISIFQFPCVIQGGGIPRAKPCLPRTGKATVHMELNPYLGSAIGYSLPHDIEKQVWNLKPWCYTTAFITYENSASMTFCEIWITHMEGSLNDGNPLANETKIWKHATNCVRRSRIWSRNTAVMTVEHVKTEHEIMENCSVFATCENKFHGGDGVASMVKCPGSKTGTQSFKTCSSNDNQGWNLKISFSNQNVYVDAQYLIKTVSISASTTKNGG